MYRARAPLSSWLSRMMIISTKPHIPKPTLITPTPPPLSSSPLSLHLRRPFTARSYVDIWLTEEEYERIREEASRELERITADMEREKHEDRERRRRMGIEVNEEEEDKEDFIGVGPYIAKIEKEMNREWDRFDDDPYECDDSGPEYDDDDDIDRAKEMRDREEKLDSRKLQRHEEIVQEFVRTDNLDDAFKWMSKLDKFEEKHYNIRPEYRVIGELINRFRDSTGKDRFLLAQKLNRALRLVQQREEFDPNNPANFSIIQREEVGPSVEAVDDGDSELKRESRGDDEEEEFDDMKERDDILLEKLNSIDKQLEEKLAQLDYTFGRKGKLLEEEIRDLAEERNSLTEKKRVPLYRKGFDVHLIDMNRTCKVTKGGQVVKYTAILACGNYNGVVGFAKARGPAVPMALQKAYEKCFQNLHYIDRYEDHTIAHAIQTTYKKTKVYLWPAKTTTGMKAGRTVQTILNLAGLKNIKSKVIGSRNPHNTVKAVFQALNAIETPKDVQGKFGRTVVESYLL